MGKINDRKGIQSSEKKYLNCNVYVCDGGGKKVRLSLSQYGDSVTKNYYVSI